MEFRFFMPKHLLLKGEYVYKILHTKLLCVPHDGAQIKGVKK